MKNIDSFKEELRWFAVVLDPRLSGPQGRLTEKLQALTVIEHDGAYVARNLNAAYRVLDRHKATETTCQGGTFGTGLTGTHGPVVLDLESVSDLASDALFHIERLEAEILRLKAPRD